MLNTPSPLTPRLTHMAGDIARFLAPNDTPRAQRIALALVVYGAGVTIVEAAKYEAITVEQAGKDLSAVAEAREADASFDAAMRHALEGMVRLKRAGSILFTAAVRHASANTEGAAAR